MMGFQGRVMFLGWADYTQDTKKIRIFSHQHLTARAFKVGFEPLSPSVSLDLIPLFSFSRTTFSLI